MWRRLTRKIYLTNFCQLLRNTEVTNLAVFRNKSCTIFFNIAEQGCIEHLLGSWQPPSLWLFPLPLGSPIFDLCVLSAQLLSCVHLFAILWMVAHQVPQSMGFSRQEYWRGLPFPTPRGLLHPGIQPASPASPALAGGFFTTSTTWEALWPMEYG